MKPMEVSINSRSITAETALRPGKYFGVSPELWLNLQVDYELRVGLIKHEPNDEEESLYRSISDWVVVTRNGALLAELEVAKGVKAIELRDSTPLWTDDFNNLLRVLK
jgi:hypothetical protein